MSGYTTIALAVGGAVMSAAGSYQQQQTANANIAMQNAINRNKAIAAQNEANFQAQVSRNNAQIARDNADAIRARGLSAEQDKALAGERVRGAIAARTAALGFVVDDDEGTTVQHAFEDAAAATALDILRIRDRVGTEVRTAEIQGVNYMAQADLFQLKGDSALSRVVQNTGGSPFMAAASSAFSSASTIAGMKWPD